MLTTTVRQNGQITLPSQLQREYGFESGDTLSFFEGQDGWILVKKVEEHPPKVAEHEPALFKKINAILLDEEQKRFDVLAEKRDSETLTSAEHTELLQLVDRIEEIQESRLEALIALAVLRQKPLKTVMEEVGLIQHGA